MPVIGVVSVRKGATIYRVPTPLTEKRRLSLAIKWIIAAARARKGKPMADRLSQEIISAYTGDVSRGYGGGGVRTECWLGFRPAPHPFVLLVGLLVGLLAALQGNAIKKKVEMHKTAEANRAYAHFRYS